MYFSRKIIPLALPILCAACMPTHNRVSDSHTMDDARARLILKTVPGFDMTQVWFATGAEYWSKGTCLAGRDIYAFTKPALSSPGVWRGKKAYVTQPTAISRSMCADPDKFDYNGSFSIDTVSFTDPDDMRPEEAWDGAIPGLFEVRGDIPDTRLRQLAFAIGQIRECLQGKATCPYPINGDTPAHWKDPEIAAATTFENLMTMVVGHHAETGEACYSMVLKADPYGAAFGMGICYRNDVIVRVDVGGEVIE